MAYNANHELTESITITQQGLDLTEITTTYQYDAFGRRISKQTQTKDKTRLVNKQSAKIIEFPVQTERTTHKQVNYLWDGNRQIQEQTDTHVFTTIYEQNSFEPVARLAWLQDGLTEPVNEPIYNDNPYIEPKIEKPPRIRVYHYHNDHLGTPNELTNQDGEVVWLADYEAWGNVAKVVYKEIQLHNITVSAEQLQPLRFQVQFIDQETGLHYNRFRYYDPDLGMFTTRDPIGLLGGNNVFQYAPNPIGWIDPFGLSCNRPGGYRNGDVDMHGNLSPQRNRAPGHRNTRIDGQIQSHHPIQDAWASQHINGYSRNKAPATLLPSSSGMPHANISAAQRARRAKPDGWNNTLREEFNIGYREMLDAGVPERQARKAYNDAYKYFDSLRSQNKDNPFFDI